MSGAVQKQTVTFQGRTSKEQLAKMSSSVVYELTKLSEEFLIGSIKGQKYQRFAGGEGAAMFVYS
ncbi:hypothetical protein E2C01_028274 [Portunus trituberculatus]|uniref:Uncharacterized protein n=1 Tax=Portunus trituberculatus TaxID=210409 RepID=A0A5B7EK77_PORTR|nr:hypothetical protein [Portunus trituberculatus]